MSLFATEIRVRVEAAADWPQTPEIVIRRSFTLFLSRLFELTTRAEANPNDNELLEGSYQANLAMCPTTSNASSRALRTNEDNHFQG